MFKPVPSSSSFREPPVVYLSLDCDGVFINKKVISALIKLITEGDSRIDPLAYSIKPGITGSALLASHFTEKPNKLPFLDEEESLAYSGRSILESPVLSPRNEPALPSSSEDSTRLTASSIFSESNSPTSSFYGSTGRTATETIVEPTFENLTPFPSKQNSFEPGTLEYQIRQLQLEQAGKLNKACDSLGMQKSPVKTASPEPEASIQERINALKTLLINTHKAKRQCVIDTNKKLLDVIIAQIQKTGASQVRIFNGSSRQSRAIDIMSMSKHSESGGKTHSVFTPSWFNLLVDILKHLTEKLPGKTVSLDTFLTFDCDKGKGPGTIFGQYLEDDFENYMNADEEDKVLLLYPQLHKAAIDNPGKQIIFKFFDDRHDILYTLKNFFSNNLDLIPSNLTLQLFHYADEVVTLQATITGEGVSDTNYQNTRQAMAQKYLKSAAGIRQITLERLPEEIRNYRKSPEVTRAVQASSSLSLS